jgi:hypothetical protein
MLLTCTQFFILSANKTPLVSTKPNHPQQSIGEGTREKEFIMDMQVSTKGEMVSVFY